MSDDLVKRLIELAYVEGEPTASTLEEAADRIEQLESLSEGWKEIADEYFDAIGERNTRIEKLEAALREITVSARLVGDYYHVKIARKALEGKDDAD